MRVGEFFYGLVVGFLAGVLATLTLGPLSGLKILLAHWR